ncbi:MAG: hypothetical protein AB7U82_00825 [Blastocatellales bacterium]
MAESYHFEAPGAHSMRGDETNGIARAAPILRAGPFNRLQQAIGLMDEYNPRTARRAVLFALVSWLPLVVLVGVQRGAIDGGPERSMLLDFSTHARFLLALPLLIVGEVAADRRFLIMSDYLVASGIVAGPERQKYARIISDTRRLRDSGVAALIFLLLAYVTSALSTFHTMDLYRLTWLAAGTDGARTLSWAGLWQVALSLPLFQFLVYSILWTWFVWLIYLWRLSRLELRLTPTHQDGVGGLSALGDSSYVIAIFVFAIGSVIGSEWAEQVAFYGASVLDFHKPFIAYLLLAILFSFGPLLIFAGRLNRLRLSGLRDYGAMVSRQAQLFDDRWIKSHEPEGKPIPGNQDIGSLSDLNNSYKAVSRMKLIPLEFRSVAVIAIAALIPMAPLILMQFPLRKVLETLVRVVF